MNQFLISSTKPRWHVVQTKPQQEARVLAVLQRQNYNCVLPMLPGSSNEPLFPRYIFVQLGDTATDAAAVRRAPGVTGLLKLDEACASVHENIVGTLSNNSMRADSFSVLNGVHEIACGIERTLELIRALCMPQAAAPAPATPLLRAA